MVYLGAISEDSGYESRQKYSVSSGESASSPPPFLHKGENCGAEVTFDRSTADSGEEQKKTSFTVLDLRKKYFVKNEK